MKTVTSLQWEQEIGNLDKDPGNRRTEIKSPRNHVRQLENKAILQFLSHLSELPDGQMSRQYSISLYEILAKKHGKSILPHISEIMGNVLKALSSNAPSLALQQACAKVVSALARYTIDSSSFAGQREGIIRDLSNPLLQVLLGGGSTPAGAAMCLQALVGSEAWKFAPNDVLNNVCSLVTAALEMKETQTASHMKLVCFLANSNSDALEVYGRLLIRAAQQILEIGAAQGNWQQCLHAVQVINSLFKYADAFYFAPEIPNTIRILERCMSDRMPFVRNGVSETLQIAKALASQSSSRDKVGFCNWAKGFRHFGDEQRPHSHSMDNVALLEKEGGSPFSTSSQIGESLTPNNGQEMDARQASHPFSLHRVKDGDCSAHMLQKSTLFENEGSSSILLKNGIVGGSHAEVIAEHETQNEEAAPRLRAGYKEEAAFSPHARNEEAAARLRPAYMGEAVFTPQDLTDYTDVHHETCSQAEWRMHCSPTSDNNEARGAKHGRILPDNLDELVEECSDGSISQEGDLQESISVFSDRRISLEGDLQESSFDSSESVHRSTISLKITDSQEHLQDTSLTEVVDGSPRINDGENKRLMTDFESVKGSTISFELQATDAFHRIWTKAASSLGTVLKVSLCVVLAVPVAMVAMEFFRMQEEYHVLVPT